MIDLETPMSCHIYSTPDTGRIYITGAGDASYTLAYFLEISWASSWAFTASDMAFPVINSEIVGELGNWQEGKEGKEEEDKHRIQA